MRSLTRVSITTAAAAASLLVAPVAHASAAVPGDNGDVKVHQSSTLASDQRDETHVCTFYLDAFNFDGLQSVNWKIERWAPAPGKKGATVDSGAITLGADGHGRTTDQSLPDGHYKLFWTFEGEHGAAKHKAFWVDCQSGTGPSSSATPTPTAPATSPSGPAGGSGSPTSGASASSGSSSSTGGAVPSGPAAGTPGGRPTLAETGANVGGIALGGLLLVGAGAALVLRRRPAGRH